MGEPDERPGGAATQAPRRAPASYLEPRAPQNPRPRRAVQVVLGLQGVVLTAFAVASLVKVLVTAGPATEVMVFLMNLPHAVILLVAGLLSLVTLISVRGARLWITGQAIGFILWFITGTSSTQPPLETWLASGRADNLGHLGLGIIAVTLFLFMAGPWLSGNRIPGKKQTGEEPMVTGVGEPRRPTTKEASDDPDVAVRGGGTASFAPHAPVVA